MYKQIYVVPAAMSLFHRPSFHFIATDIASAKMSAHFRPHVYQNSLILVMIGFPKQLN